MTASLNQAFQVPPELEAALRARAAAEVAAIDEDALLAQYVAEAKAARLLALREKADALANEPAQLDAQNFPKRYVEIIIYKGRDSKQDLAYVPIGVNGFHWKITRGARVIVPDVVTEVLEHAVGEDVVQAEGGLITQPVHRFPYQVLRTGVPEAEYLAFRAKMRASPQAVVS